MPLKAHILLFVIFRQTNFTWLRIAAQAGTVTTSFKMWDAAHVCPQVPIGTTLLPGPYHRHQHHSNGRMRLFNLIVLRYRRVAVIVGEQLRIHISALQDAKLDQQLHGQVVAEMQHGTPDQEPVHCQTYPLASGNAYS